MNDKTSEQPVDEKVNDIVQEFDPGYAEKARKNSNANLHLRLDSLQESLDYLRVCIKYQTFDLEATRRENAHLRKLLDGPAESNPEDDPSMV